MLFVNRDGVGVPDVMDELAKAVRASFDGATVVPITTERGFEVQPRQSSSFSVYFFDEMITADGTAEQNARLAVLVGRVATRHGVRMLALTPDGSMAHTLDEPVTPAELRDAQSWRPIDPGRLGQGDAFDLGGGS